MVEFFIYVRQCNSSNISSKSSAISYLFLRFLCFVCCCFLVTILTEVKTVCNIAVTNCLAWKYSIQSPESVQSKNQSLYLMNNSSKPIKQNKTTWTFLCLSLVMLRFTKRDTETTPDWISIVNSTRISSTTNLKKLTGKFGLISCYWWFLFLLF